VPGTRAALVAAAPRRWSSYVGVRTTSKELEIVVWRNLDASGRPERDDPIADARTILSAGLDDQW
jgi:hypothetical protein